MKFVRKIALYVCGITIERVIFNECVAFPHRFSHWISISIAICPRALSLSLSLSSARSRSHFRSLVNTWGNNQTQRLIYIKYTHIQAHCIWQVYIWTVLFVCHCKHLLDYMHKQLKSGVLFMSSAKCIQYKGKYDTCKAWHKWWKTYGKIRFGSNFSLSQHKICGRVVIFGYLWTITVWIPSAHRENLMFNAFQWMCDAKSYCGRAMDRFVWI